MIANSPYGLAMDDYAPLQELKLRQTGVLPSKPKAKIFMNVFGFVNATLKCHYDIGYQLQILENQPEIAKSKNNIISFPT